MDNPVVKVEPVIEEQIDSASAKVFEDTEIDIVNWTNKVDACSNTNEDPDATEYSSSFVDSDSETENSSRSSDAEAESEFFADNCGGRPFDTFDPAFRMSRLYRKKNVTEHWRNYIGPLMWRCKWTELRLKQLESQALKYTRELEDYDKGKHVAPDDFNLEEFGSKSLPFTSHQYRSKAILRRRRKKVENTTDIATYTSQHPLFSHLESKKSDADASLDDDFDNPVLTERPGDLIGEDQRVLEFKDNDIPYEMLLWSIDKLQCKVRAMKNGIDTIASRNALRFSAQSPANSAANGYTASAGGMYNSSQNVADEFESGDMVFADSAANIPDIIESTVGLFPGAEVTLQSAFVADSGENMVDNVLMHEAEGHNFKSANNYPIEKLKEVKTEAEEGSQYVSIPMSDFNAATATTSASQEQSAAKTCVNKRKRGERKAGSGGWNKKSPGEPDN